MKLRVALGIALICLLPAPMSAESPKTRWLTGWATSVGHGSFTLKMHFFVYWVHVTPETQVTCHGHPFAIEKLKVGDSLDVVGPVVGQNVNAVSITMRLRKSQCQR